LGRRSAEFPTPVAEAADAAVASMKDGGDFPGES